VARFVILEHTGAAEYKPGVHWDLMLEMDVGLRTWELESPPSKGVAVRATELGVHRLDYLDYEGPVSGNRGSVRRWDGGTYKVLSETPGELDLAIRGERFNGRMVLRRDAANESNWVVRYNSENSIAE
jgi:DNA polymerase ligase (LigD)-like protein